MAPFHALAHLERGKFTVRPRNDPKYYGGSIPFIQTGDVTKSNGRIKTFSQTLNQAGLKVSKLFPRGTLFFTIAANIGDVGFVNFDTACPDSLVAITPVKRVHAGWLAHELRMRKPLFENLASQNAQLNINFEKLRPYLLPVPSQPEQEAIAEALSDADASIESLEQLLVKKRWIKQGAMQELLRPKPADDVRPLGHVSSLKGRIGWQGLKQSEFTTDNDEPFLITGMNFKDGAIRWNEVYHISEARYEMAPEIQLRPHDVLMTKDGTIGKVLYIDAIPYPGKASLNSHLLLFRPIGSSYNPKYLYYHLGSRPFKDFVEQSKSGTTFFGLSQAAVATYPVLLPPLAEQARIAAVLSDMDIAIAACEAQLAKAGRIKQGMMQELLTGRIRLV